MLRNGETDSHARRFSLLFPEPLPWNRLCQVCERMEFSFLFSFAVHFVTCSAVDKRIWTVLCSPSGHRHSCCRTVCLSGFVLAGGRTLKDVLCASVLFLWQSQRLDGQWKMYLLYNRTSRFQSRHIVLQSLVALGSGAFVVKEKKWGDLLDTKPKWQGKAPCSLKHSQLREEKTHDKTVSWLTLIC